MRRFATGLAACVLVLVTQTGCQEIEARRTIQAGTAAYRGEEYDKAVVAFDKAVALAPQISTGWWNLGMAHLAIFAPGLNTPENERHAVGAIQALEKYLTLEPGDMRARDQLIGTYINAGKYEGALAYYQRQLDAKPGDLAALTQLGEINAMAGRFDVAFDWYRKRIEAEPTSDGKATAYYDMGRIVFGRLNRHPEVAGEARAKLADEGLFALQKAVELRPTHEPSNRFMALVLRERALAHGSSYARVIDIVDAEVWRKKAEELLKAQSGAGAGSGSGAPAGAPPKNGEGH